ncbi:hypothetical protein AX16_003619 [Volvariella volvacea WC 439]|nr:hypothetical protein AX16_003619 [Volvariella volvacea WC 439]
MLPSNPRVGLPTTPRSRSVGPARRHDTHAASLSQQPPGNHSTRLHSQARGPSRPPLPPPPPFPLSASRQVSRQPQAAPDGTDRLGRPPTSTRKSDDSTSSYASSILSRARGRPGYSSSRTSLEEISYPPQQNTYSERERSFEDQRDVAEEPRTTLVEDNEHKSQTESTANGRALWNRVVDVASNLTVNVGQAWATNVPDQDGEETPPGQDSRLTQAMKAYYLEKARHPSDLPDWLFNDKERGLKPSLRAANAGGANSDRESIDSAKDDRLRSNHGLATATGTQALSQRGASRYGDGGPAPSRAADRLKAMREARRGGSSNSSSMVGATRSDEKGRSGNDGSVIKGAERTGRVGLPSRPRREG